MAVDKKSQHVGNHGGRYTDLEGMSKQFTYVDHDPKTKISVPAPDTDFKKELSDYRKALIQRILDLPASAADLVHSDFTQRGDKEKVSWNENMVTDPGISMERLNELYTITSNRLDLYGKR